MSAFLARRGVPCALIARDVADEFFQWVKVIQRGLNDGQARDSTTQISFSRGARVLFTLAKYRRCIIYARTQRFE